MFTGNLFKLLVFMALFFLSLTALHQWTVLKDNAKALRQAQQRDLNYISQLIVQETQKYPVRSKDLSAHLSRWAGAFGIDRVTLYPIDGKEISSDSVGEFTGTPVSLNSPPDKIRQALTGKTLFSYPEDNAEGYWEIYTPLRNKDGSIRAVIRLTDQKPALVDPTGSSVTALLLKIFGFATVTVLGYSFIRSGITSWHRRRGEQPPSGESSETDNTPPSKRDRTDFVLDTFQSVVLELKEKEQELERLRKAAEEKAKDIESYNENILRSVNSGVITFNPSRRITTFNQAAERILGMKSSDVIGKTCEEIFGAQHPVHHLLDRALSKEEVTARQEFEMQGPENRKIWVGVSTSLLKDQEELVIGTTFVFTDLTEIRKLQEQIEMKKRLTVLGEMSAGIAHEFRNFMGTILGFAKLLSKQVEAQDPRQANIDAIIQEIKAMERMISELLSFSRSTELNCQPLPLVPFLNKIFSQALPETASPKPELLLDIPEDIPPVYGDEVLLRQAFSNLAQNGVQAMGEGGLLRVSARFIFPSTVEINVQDSGVGIPKENLDRIFLPFFTTKEKGTGLGLALVHKIVLSHNGRVEVKSEEGKGTVFQVYLPTLGTSVKPLEE